MKKMSDEKEGKHDAEEVKEILNVVAEKVPELLNQLADVLYGAQQSAKYAKAVSQFYKELKDAGMTDAQAFELTRQYMSIFNIGGALGKMMTGGGLSGWDDDIGKEIKLKIKERIKKDMESEE